MLVNNDQVEMWYFRANVEISQPIINLTSKGKYLLVKVEQIPHKEVSHWKMIEFNSGEWGEIAFGGWISRNNRFRIKGENH